ncbi:MAG: hypothetical protein ACLQO1_24195 [Steroidobacteraceae bacterium]
MTELGNDMVRVAIASHEPDHMEKQKMVTLFDEFARKQLKKANALSNSTGDLRLDASD